MTLFNHIFYRFRIHQSSTGYGHISPSTVGGQIFCIFYALLGIPLCGILLSALGDRLCKIKATGLERANDKLKLKKQWQQKIFKMFATLFVGLGLFIFIPASIFVAVEGWDYHEAWYYCFITLTTVGFGDFVAGKIDEKVYTIFTWGVNI